MTYILVDMDGTLSDGEHRLHYINTKPKNWPAFFRAGAHDEPFPTIKRLVMDNHGIGRRIVIFTARPESNREITETWLKKHEIPYDRVIMRKKNDYRPDFIVKKEMLDEVIVIYGGVPVFAIDDKPEVLTMFRENDIAVLDATFMIKNMAHIVEDVEEDDV